jgi:iron complex outermembrane recepter protein
VLPLSEQWRVEAAYTYLDATFRSPYLTCPAASTCTAPNTIVPAGSRIPGVPRSDFYTALKWDGGSGWNASLETNAASKAATNDLNTEFAPGFGLLNASVGYHFIAGHAQINTFVRMNNILDHSYVGSIIVNESNGRYYEPGIDRMVMGGVQIAWGGQH